jgi:toxin ParE1/3/4
MKNCRFSLEARRDLQGIHDYIAADDPTAALRLIEKIEQSCELLAEHPLLGEACEFLADRLRMTAVGNYIIFHRPDNDGTKIVRVVHGARDWRRLF